MKILIDNGHGVTTPGKCSPDGRLREFRYCREVADLLVARLKARGLDASRIVPEEGDISLAQRVARVNAVCDRVGAGNVLLVSIHVNAAGGDGKWHEARGLSVHVSPRASEASRHLGRCIYEAGASHGVAVTGNRSVPAARVWPQNLYICNRTRCPAVLVENLFQDNRDDVDFLLSPKGRETVAAYLCDGILDFLRK